MVCTNICLQQDLTEYKLKKKVFIYTRTVWMGVSKTTKQGEQNLIPFYAASVSVVYVDTCRYSHVT
jgi:hypothetical protein